ncbi:3-hydroxybutyrate dehydrogenase type 2 (plasmid) [Burkholderia pseudomallei]|uniref:3-hydroxybutyrate dehydrogenase type 2 n=1 Tax=Burkholderia pseudomallei TaxID=28450 RepID=A0AA40JI96_BURPE|nr:SDR family oxidoreductase [Burkholderia pseudomallei]AIV73773.1 3-hydroxybutyrate dehydrogenase type 2 [Burkholderia pseudomallei]KGS72513.1 3-hydroxybutyrate dehydrogenase type 2 [Burkholderia pseudomallei MSHR5596]KGW78500.1 3-hydroxybutyrate dehydrogenase type 2 [Burkholderia pseudomallei MSHR2990]KGX17041.1 3-hydroxybutyrate dehydrogenase type 2 [Burkholderia pseudomallei]
MSGRLAGKRAVVTAAANGIGKAAALAFAREGAKVWACDIDAAALDRIEHPSIERHRLDVCDGDAIDAFARGIGRIDVLFNCAGIVHQGTVLDCDADAWQRSMEVNVLSMHRLIRAVLPGMLASGGGSIVNMSSAASSVKGFPNRYVYGASKAAVVGMTKAIAADFVKRNIRCNAVCPGTVDTPSLRARIASAEDPVQALKDFIARQPMGRLATVDDVTPMLVYLASDESAFVTGQALCVDGGITL